MGIKFPAAIHLRVTGARQHCWATCGQPFPPAASDAAEQFCTLHGLDSPLWLTAYQANLLFATCINTVSSTRFEWKLHGVSAELIEKQKFFATSFKQMHQQAMLPPTLDLPLADIIPPSPIETGYPALVPLTSLTLKAQKALLMQFPVPKTPRTSVGCSGNDASGLPLLFGKNRAHVPLSEKDLCKLPVLEEIPRPMYLLNHEKKEWTVLSPSLITYSSLLMQSHPAFTALVPVTGKPPDPFDFPDSCSHLVDIPANEMVFDPHTQTRALTRAARRRIGEFYQNVVPVSRLRLLLPPLAPEMQRLIETPMTGLPTNVKLYNLQHCRNALALIQNLQHYVFNEKSSLEPSNHHVTSLLITSAASNKFMSTRWASPAAVFKLGCIPGPYEAPTPISSPRLVRAVPYDCLDRPSKMAVGPFPERLQQKWDEATAPETLSALVKLRITVLLREDNEEFPFVHVIANPSKDAETRWAKQLKDARKKRATINKKIKTGLLRQEDVPPAIVYVACSFLESHPQLPPASKVKLKELSSRYGVDVPVRSSYMLYNWEQVKKNDQTPGGDTNQDEPTSGSQSLQRPPVGLGEDTMSRDASIRDADDVVFENEIALSIEESFDDGE